MIRLAQQLFVYITCLFFPLKCLKCGKIISKDRAGSHNDCFESLFSDFFCSDCISIGFVKFEPPFCKRCGVKFETIEHGQDQNHVCGQCIKTSCNTGQVRAGARYKGLVKESISLFKYQKKLGLASPLEKIIFSAFEKYFSFSEIDIVIPVPLHISKLRFRGFNQSFLIIKHFKKILKDKKIDFQFDIDISSLIRIKKTNPQTQFSLEQRKENVQGAFKVIDVRKVKDKRVLLIDDVYTTGATAKEAASELIKAGAINVDVLVIARV